MRVGAGLTSNRVGSTAFQHIEKRIRMDAIYLRIPVKEWINEHLEENQIEECRKAINKREYKVYKDTRFSGKLRSCPGYTLMMNDIRAGKIERVITYKASSLTRNIVEFASSCEEMERYGVYFVSVKDGVNTATPSGRCVLGVVRIYAELQREQALQSKAYRDKGLER